MQGSPDWHERAEWARAKGQQADLQESESKLSLSKLGWRDLECGRLAAALEGDLPPPSVTEPGNGQQNGAAWFRFEAARALVIFRSRGRVVARVGEPGAGRPFFSGGAALDARSRLAVDAGEKAVIGLVEILSSGAKAGSALDARLASAGTSFVAARGNRQAQAVRKGAISQPTRLAPTGEAARLFLRIASADSP